MSLLRSSRPQKILLHVTDEIIAENNGTFSIEMTEAGSICRRAENGENADTEVAADIAELTEFVFGKREIKGLEEIHTLNRICINEAV